MASSRVVRRGALIYYGSLRALGVTAIRRRLCDGGLILCYHNVVADHEHSAGGVGLHIPCERFERQVRWLAAHYDVVSLRELVDRLASGATLRSTAAITFDDAYTGVFDHAVPLLSTLGVPATIFVVADAPGRLAGFWWDHPDVVRCFTADRREAWLSQFRGDGAAILSDIRATSVTLPAAHRPADWATIRAHAKNGIDIGVHTATHRSMPRLDDVELEHEIVTSRSVIHRTTGIRPEFFAYPYGHHDARIRALVRKAGYRAALSLEPGLNSVPTDPWCLRRVNVPAGISDAAFEAWAAGLHLHKNG